MLEIIANCKLKRSLKQHTIKHQLVELISSRVKSSIPRLAELGHRNEELLLLIANCIENTVEKRYKLNKMEILKACVKSIFPLVEDKDLEGDVEKIVQFFIDNNMVKRVPYLKKMWKWLFSSKKKD